MRTDTHPEGFLLDRGFQVFLDSYPEAKRHLDYRRLDLRSFEPGAMTRVSNVDGWHALVDPIRRPGRALGVALSPAATVRDKWLVARLRFRVLRGDAGDLLSQGETAVHAAVSSELGL